MWDMVLRPGWAVSPEGPVHLTLPEQVWILCTSSPSPGAAEVVEWSEQDPVAPQGLCQCL